MVTFVLRLTRFYVAFAGVLLAVPSSYSGEDLQSWNSLKLGWDLGERVASTTVFEGRLYEDASDLRHKRVGQVFDYKLTSRIRLGIGFRHTWKKSASGSKSSEDRLEVTLSHPVFNKGSWKADLRHRLQQVSPSHGKEDIETYRNRLRLRRSFEEPAILKDYFATFEGFYSFDESRIVETRLVPIGWTFMVGDNSTISAGYLLRSNRKATGWQHIHALEFIFGVDI